MFNILKKVFSKTSSAIKEVAVEKKIKITHDEFEEILLEADVNYALIEELLTTLPSTITRVQAFNALITVFQYKADWKDDLDVKPFVDMIIGVNGAGKTTTIAKLARYHQKQNKTVLLGAADTFRAAAIEQLTRWANKLEIPIISTRQGHDPSAVVYDTIASAKAKGIDHVLIDTAGRLHTQTNLGEELKKMVRIADKSMVGAPHRKMLILDGHKGVPASTKPKSLTRW